MVWEEDRDRDFFEAINREIAPKLSILPKLYQDDRQGGFVLQEDCGHNTLLDYCKKNPETIETIYKKTLDASIQWHEVIISQNSRIRSRSMDQTMFLWETEYFANHCVAQYCQCEKLLDSDWEKERQELARLTLQLPGCLIHRDFQSENIMVGEDQIKFVDFQGARIGPAEYDLASLLYDPYADFLSFDMVEKLLDYYRDNSKQSISWETFHLAATQRLMQALGAYGNLALNKGKKRYLHFVPLALERLNHVLNQQDRFPHSKKIVETCLEKCPVRE